GRVDLHGPALVRSQRVDGRRLPWLNLRVAGEQHELLGDLALVVNVNGDALARELLFADRRRALELLTGAQQTALIDPGVAPLAAPPTARMLRGRAQPDHALAG